MPVWSKFDGGGEKPYFQAQEYLRCLFRTLFSGRSSCGVGFIAQGGLGSPKPRNDGASGGMMQLGRGEAHGGSLGLCCPPLSRCSRSWVLLVAHVRARQLWCSLQVNDGPGLGPHGGMSRGGKAICDLSSGPLHGGLRRDRKLAAASTDLGGGGCGGRRLPAHSHLLLTAALQDG